MNERVRLIHTLDPVKMPIGLVGTVVEGNIHVRGMVRVQWDNGYNIPMFRRELELIKETDNVEVVFDGNP